MRGERRRGGEVVGDKKGKVSGREEERGLERGEKWWKVNGDVEAD